MNKVTIVKANGAIREAIPQAIWNDSNDEEIMVVKVCNEPMKNRKNSKAVAVRGITLRFENATQAAKELFPDANVATTANRIRECCRGVKSEYMGCVFDYCH